MKMFLRGVRIVLTLLLATAAAPAGAAKAKKAAAGPAGPVNSLSDYAWMKNGAPLKGGLKTFQVGQVSSSPIPRRLAATPDAVTLLKTGQATAR
jgi:hypothetical protein